MLQKSSMLLQRAETLTSRFPPEESKIMGIPNELSSDVAAAVLARKDSQVQDGTLALIEIVRNFHSAMRDLKS
jgi:hypothetical protein